MADPLADLAAWLSEGEDPPVAWVLSHAPDGDLARLWAACADVAALAYLTATASPADLQAAAVAAWDDVERAGRPFDMDGLSTLRGLVRWARLASLGMVTPGDAGQRAASLCRHDGRLGGLLLDALRQHVTPPTLAALLRPTR